MKGNTMTQKSTVRSNAAGKLIKFGATMAMAVLIGTPLQAQDTIVEGNVQRGEVVQERVAYSDLNLSEQPNQIILISRVRKAAGRVCNILYRGENPRVKFESRCPQKTYTNAKPQIDLAIANAQNGKRVAMTVVIARSR
jgi:UrcA family protein